MGLSGRVAAAQGSEGFFVEALDAKGDPGDPEVAEDGQLVGPDGGWRELDGPFTRRGAKVVEEGAAQALEIAGGKGAGGATAPEDGFGGLAGAGEDELAFDALEKAVEFGAFGLFLVEGAKVTGGGAKGDVDIDAEAIRGRGWGGGGRLRGGEAGKQRRGGW